MQFVPRDKLFPFQTFRDYQQLPFRIIESFILFLAFIRLCSVDMQFVRRDKLFPFLVLANHMLF